MKKMRKYKSYGDTRTNLTLTEKAHAFYSVTDPLAIYEKPNGLYDVVGAFERYDMTEAEVNEFFESIYDEIMSEQQGDLCD